MLRAALVLWLSFGGTVPFKAQGYRIRISFTNAAQLAQEADVRIAGVSVGKVIDKQLDPQGNRTIATIEMQRQYAPIHENARAILRLKTMLGETRRAHARDPEQPAPPRRRPALTLQT